MQLKRYNTGMSTFELKIQTEPKQVKSVEFPASYFRSPQFYYTDQERFESKPRQLQMPLCGRVTYPFPMELPRFSEEQKTYSLYLLSSILVGDTFVKKEAFNDIVRQATMDNAVGPSHKLELCEDIFDRKNTMDTTSGENPFDAKYNRSFSKRASKAHSMSTMLKSASRLGSRATEHSQS